jgi:four helix bundle protein
MSGADTGTRLAPCPDEINQLISESVHEGRAPYGERQEEPFGYKRLTVYQRSMELVVEAYALTQRIPEVERYGLISQIRRAAISVPLNLAEGWGRNTSAELARSADIARGSANEVDAALHVCTSLGYLTVDQAAEAVRLANVVSSQLRKLSASLRK